MKSGDRKKQSRGRTVALVMGVAVVCAWLALSLRTPSNDRIWVADQTRLPLISLDGDSVQIQGMRDFRYDERGGMEARYLDERYALSDVQRVWFALAPFASRYRGLAHSFLSFEFADGRFVAISVEARKEVGEDYSLLGGLLRGK